eukprot:scaffold186280_cov35-Prasinocladus_malaysianus.AAC.1
MSFEIGISIFHVPFVIHCLASTVCMSGYSANKRAVSMLRFVDASLGGNMLSVRSNGSCNPLPASNTASAYLYGYSQDK